MSTPIYAGAFKALAEIEWHDIRTPDPFDPRSFAPPVQDIASACKLCEWRSELWDVPIFTALARAEELAQHAIAHLQDRHPRRFRSALEHR